jgi:hypothetical protein
VLTVGEPVQPIQPRPITGHVFKWKGKRGSTWYAKYRFAGWQATAKRIGPAWTQRSAPPEGYFTKTSAKAWLDDLLAQARQGTLPGLVKTGKKFRDVSADWLAYCENIRDCKPSTMRDYRNMVRVLDRDFGDRKIESITSEEIELWVANRKGANRTLHKYVVVLGGIFKRAMRLYGLPRNPVDIVERRWCGGRRRSTCCGRTRSWPWFGPPKRGAIDRRRIRSLDPAGWRRCIVRTKWTRGSFRSLPSPV